MATVPYQSTYSLPPKYGTRYGPSQFAPATASASPQTLGTAAPAVGTVGAGVPGQAGTQQTAGVMGSTTGTQTTQPLAFNQDPFAFQGAIVNGQQQQGVGFRDLPPGAYPPVGSPPTAPVVPPTTTPPPSGADPVVAAMQQAGGDDNGGFDYAASRIPQAQGLGYARGTQNPLGLALAAIPGGSFLSNAMGINDEYTYGSYGTYDAQGNVFGPEGRAYDPITGRAVASYASPSAAMSTIGGGYSKLRDAGEGVISSALGSYDNSVYKQMDLDPTLNIAGARAARMRGEGAPMGTVADLINMNTQIAAGDYTGLSDDDIDRVEGTPITATQLGFTGDRPAPSNISGKFGTQTGDIVALEGGQFGVRNESGTIETPTGTVVSISDSTRPGENISLLSNDPATQLRANQELSLRAGENDGQGSMSGFNVSDGQGGSYQTSSSGNTGADASGQFGTQGAMGMEDEYDEPVDTGGGNESSGGK